MVTKKLLTCSLLLGFLALTLLLLGTPSAFAQTNTVSSKLQVADDAVNQAFGLVLDAERSGANGSNLLIQLNVAANLLSQAENAYRIGDNKTASADAGNVVLIAQHVSTEAQSLKQEVAVSSQNAFWFPIVFSVGSSVVFVLVLFFGWRRFQRNYVKKLSDAKQGLT